MQDRDIPAELLMQVIDTGHVRYSDEVWLWAWLEVPGRCDNLLCAALVLEQAVVVKTVMHHWEVTP